MELDGFSPHQDCQSNFTAQRDPLLLTIHTCFKTANLGFALTTHGQKREKGDWDSPH